MFHHRPSAFASSIAASQKHLGAVEKELENIGRIAGEKTSAAAKSAATSVSDQLSDAIGTIVNEMVERLRQGRRTTVDQAARLGRHMLDTGASYGSTAVERVSNEIEERPFITMSVALGIGILIGAMIFGAATSGRR
jgi:ElaB/YqjD/DUF883 family membrane-anchored ribosome-binding protein